MQWWWQECLEVSATIIPNITYFFNCCSANTPHGLLAHDRQEARRSCGVTSLVQLITKSGLSQKQEQLTTVTLSWDNQWMANNHPDNEGSFCSGVTAGNVLLGDNSCSQSVQ